MKLKILDLNLKLQKPQYLIYWLIIVLISAGFSVVILQSKIFKIEDKTISIVNFYPTSVKLSTNKAQLFNLEPYDVLSFNISSKTDYVIDVLDNNSKIIKTININELKNAAQLINITLGNGDYCYFSTNLNNLINNSESPEITVNTLTLKNQDSIITKLDLITNEYFYPGKNVVKQNNKNLIGIYPIECRYIDNQDQITSTILLFKDYSSVKQRNFLENQTKKIQNTTDINELIK